jgi:hypothetical protein
VAVQFKKGAAALVGFVGTAPVAGEGYLRWFLPPAALRAMANDSG